MDMLASEALALLACGPSSFAALFGFLKRDGLVETVGDVWTRLREMEAARLVAFWRLTHEGGFVAPTEDDLMTALSAYEAWFSDEAAGVAVEDVSVDEVGIWVSSTSEHNMLASSEAWQLDFDATRERLEVCAASETLAKRQLQVWLEANPMVDADVANRELEPVTDLVLRSGHVLPVAVRLRVHCTSRAKKA